MSACFVLVLELDELGFAKCPDRLLGNDLDFSSVETHIFCNFRGFRVAAGWGERGRTVLPRGGGVNGDIHSLVIPSGCHHHDLWGGRSVKIVTLPWLGVCKTTFAKGIWR